VFVLDERRRPVPVGVPGELYIGGDGVVRGYLNRAELTAERFVNLAVARDARAYRTGDLVRYLPDGRLEFLGRLDHQVKIRGHRIELGEIEAALSTHPDVRGEVIVADADDADGGKILVAYLKNPAPPAAELRQFLETTLPAFMVPSAFVFLDVFPLTPNLKIDRKRLPRPETVKTDKPVVAPRTPVEESLARIWKEALRIENIGVHDNFFELGGHSLTAVKITGRIRAAFTTALPLQTVLDNPTIAQLAAQLENLRKDAPPVQPVPPPIVRSALRRRMPAPVN